MIGIVLLGHLKLGPDLLDAVSTLVPSVENATTVSFKALDDRDIVCAKISEAIRQVDRGDGVLVLTDIFGSCCTKMCAEISDPSKVVIVYGMNLPMLIAAFEHRGDKSLDELATFVEERGKQFIGKVPMCCASPMCRDDVNK